MNEQIFWEIIENYKWSKDYNYNRISKELLNNSYILEEEKKDFLSFCDNLHNTLYKFIDNLEDDIYRSWDS